MTEPDRSARLSAYIEDHFAEEGPVLKELRAEITREAMPEIYISAEQGKLLQVLLTAVGARRVLEIGTLGGYSALWMARALPADGRLITLEKDPDRAAFARRFIDKAGLGGVIEVRVGEARQVLVELVDTVASGAEKRFDAVFIDADKEPFVEYLERSLDLVRPGGLILGDNAFRDGRILEDEPDAATQGVLDYNRRSAADPRLVSTIIPVRDGLTVSVVRE